MSIPNTAREYRLPKLGKYQSGAGIEGLVFQTSAIASPKATEVLVKIHAVSLNYRDLAMAIGVYPQEIKENVVPGSDCAGEIVALGSDVQGWSNGDRVCVSFSTAFLHGHLSLEVSRAALGGPSDGVLVEYRTFPANALVRVPEHLSYEEASTLPCAALTAYNALMGPVPLKGGDTVLVLGTGGVSIFALQIAVASGATVIVTSSSDSKLELAKKLGAQHVINYNKTADWDKEVLRITGDQGANHIIEVGGSGTLAKSFQCVSYGGWIHSIGFVAAGGERVDANIAAMLRGCSLRGIVVGSVVQFKDMNRLLVANQIKPVVDKVFAFEELKEAYNHLAAQKFFGKIVVKVAKE
ncbi:NAD(P)-binding protein [Athelia psychrophila]|uniref:NAD(P)-binding protein n=1 Tax=Athelia psychrophila TaxID=1759441 RepID=A0A166VVS2_9AGAM|nr:NAD(P)-binding protein [Fibularhizoctonia sp. CBS 109695]